MALTKQEIDEQIAHEKELIRELVRRRRILETQAAKTGNNVRPEVLTEMSDLTNEIRAHEEEIARLEALPITVKQLRVLYVEDVEHYTEQYMKVLQAHFGVDHVKHVKTAPLGASAHGGLRFSAREIA